MAAKEACQSSSGGISSRQLTDKFIAVLEDDAMGALCDSCAKGLLDKELSEPSLHNMQLNI